MEFNQIGENNNGHSVAADGDSALAVTPEAESMCGSQIAQHFETEKILNEMGYHKNSIFDFLETESGQKLSKELFGLLHGYQKKESKLETSKIVIIALIIVVSGVLISIDKFDPSLAVLMGSLAGYLFGKSND